MSKRRPPALEALGKLAGVSRLTDDNLKNLHDLAVIALVRCQAELQRRGTPSSVLVQRVEGLSLLSTHGGKGPICRCNVSVGEVRS